MSAPTSVLRAASPEDAARIAEVDYHGIEDRVATSETRPRTVQDEWKDCTLVELLLGDAAGSPEPSGA